MSSLFSFRRPYFVSRKTYDAKVAELRQLMSDRGDAFVKDRAAIILQRDNWESKYKAAITDLAAARDEVEGLRGDVAAAEKAADGLTTKFNRAAGDVAALTDQLATLRPIAEKAIAKAARDAAAKRVKRGVGK